MSNVAQEDGSNMEERCQELIVIARQWEEQMSDLRSFSQIEKETLENEISCLQEVHVKNQHEKQSLENSLMLLEEERVSWSVVPLYTSRFSTHIMTPRSGLYGCLPVSSRRCGPVPSMT